MVKNKRKLITIAAINMLLILTLTATFAWFFVNKEIEIDFGSEIECEASSSLEISLYQGLDENSEEDWSEYSSYVKYSGVTPKIQDITGDGANLYKPTSIVTNPDTNELEPEGFAPATNINETGYGDYLEIEIRLRSISTMNVYFGGASIVEPLKTVDTDRNIFGDFSKNYIAGAIRVAILEQDKEGNEELKMIWAPNPYIQLIDNKDGTYDLNENGTIENYSYYKKNLDTDEFYKYDVTSNDFASKKFVLGSTGTTESMVANSPLITQIFSNQLGDDDQNVEDIYKTLIIRIWFEGTDREANQALSGGQVKMNLKFIGMAAKGSIAQEKIDKINNIQISNDNGNYSVSGLNSEMKYSFDGYTWKDYTSDANINTDLKDVVTDALEDVILFVKYPETINNSEYMISRVIDIEEVGEVNE